VSACILDASYALMWCFPDRATANTDAALRRMEAHSDSAVVFLGVAGGSRQRLGNREHSATHLAVRQDLSLYDTCYLQAALVSSLPLATNHKKLRSAADPCGVPTLVP
jgi:hypothetical protein